jgi:tRNA threonylcarbamoyladenosine biosynthesis protein TsaB
VRVLAVDTTTPRGSLAVIDGEELLGEVRLLSQAGHSARLLPAVAFLLEGLGLRPADLHGFAVALGPGSFTGLRVGISTVQGLALAAGRPSLGLSALDVLAHRICGSAELLVPLMDAYRDEVFAATYDTEARQMSPPVAAVLESVLEGLPAGSLALAGDGAQRYRDRIRVRRPDALFPGRSLFLASTLARLAEPRLAAGEGGGPEALRPLYLRDAAIRRPAR